MLARPCAHPSQPLNAESHRSGGPAFPSHVVLCGGPSRRHTFMADRFNGTDSYDLVFLGLARDCGETIPPFLDALEQLATEGLRVHAVVGENGSRDGSRELLAASSRVDVVDTAAMAAVPRRLERMAKGRDIVARAA